MTRQKEVIEVHTSSSWAAESVSDCQASIPNRQVRAVLIQIAVLDIDQSTLQTSAVAHLIGLSLDSSSWSSRSSASRLVSASVRDLQSQRSHLRQSIA